MAQEPIGATSEEVVVVHEPVSFQSTDGHSTCRGDLWYPAHNAPKGVVQLVHGMAEYIGRYTPFALELVAAGYAVCGTDHIGHGRTTPDPAERGVYDPKHGADHLIEDQHLLRLRVQRRFPDVPYVVFGHSMGSFVTRCYIQRHGAGLAAAVIMGTGWQASATVTAGKGLVRAMALVKGWDYRSKLVDGMGVGGYNKKFEGTGAKTGVEWLSREEKRCTDYVADPDCGFMFSISGYNALFTLLGECEDSRQIANVPQDLPILVISGGDDPVGEFGDGPAQVADALEAAGVQDVTLELIEGARHEILGETNKAEVFRTIIDWINAHSN